VAIYRAERGRRIALAAGVAAIVGLVFGLVLGRMTAPDLGARLNEARAAAAPIRSSLEVVRTEYSKLLAGGADPGGAPAAMDKIDAVYATAAPSLALIDAAASAALGKGLEDLRSAMKARAPEADVDAAIVAAEAALDAILPTTPGPSGA
jgi:hypothetical protein